MNKYSVICLLSGCLYGCGSATHAPVVEGSAHSPATFRTDAASARNSKGTKILHMASEFIGTPYRYGGDDPSGFDCSGLVLYTHQHVGIQVPRTAKGQYTAARNIRTEDLSPGDVIFFRLKLWQVSHVGIYAGNGEFIHAPKSGKRVMASSLNSPFWRDRIVKAGRFY